MSPGAPSPGAPSPGAPLPSRTSPIDRAHIRRGPAAVALLLVLLVGSTACELAPAPARSEPTRAARGSAAGRGDLPQPHLEALAPGEERATGSGPSFRPAGDDPLAEGDEGAAGGNGAPLSDRLRIRPRGEGATQGRPERASHREHPRGADPRDEPVAELAELPGDDLRRRRDKLLGELERYRGRDEHDLRDGDRLAKHRLQTQLIALHFLLDGEEDLAALADLLESLDAPAAPGRVHSLLRAALYEAVDLEERSAAVLTGLRAGGGALRISAPVPCDSIEGLGRYQAATRDRFRPGESLRLYSEVYGLENERVGARYRPRLEVELVLLDRAGAERDRVAIATEARPTDEPVADSFLVVPYTLPREAPFGEARLVLSVKDLLSGAAARQERSIRIAP